MDGYGVLRNMFQDGNYNFGKAEPDTVKAVHDIEDEFGAVSYTHLTLPTILRV